MRVRKLVSATMLNASCTDILPSGAVGGEDQSNEKPKPHFPMMSRATFGEYMHML